MVFGNLLGLNWQFLVKTSSYNRPPNRYRLFESSVPIGIIGKKQYLQLYPKYARDFWEL